MARQAISQLHGKSRLGRRERRRPRQKRPRGRKRHGVGWVRGLDGRDDAPPRQDAKVAHRPDARQAEIDRYQVVREGPGAAHAKKARQGGKGAALFRPVRLSRGRGGRRARRRLKAMARAIIAGADLSSRCFVFRTEMLPMAENGHVKLPLLKGTWDGRKVLFF